MGRCGEGYHDFGSRRAKGLLETEENMGGKKVGALAGVDMVMEEIGYKKEQMWGKQKMSLLSELSKSSGSLGRGQLLGCRSLSIFGPIQTSPRSRIPGTTFPSLVVFSILALLRSLNLSKTPLCARTNVKL
jgi:hypothetical protein